jgi:hypothetical protein
VVFSVDAVQRLLVSQSEPLSGSPGRIRTKRNFIEQVPGKSWPADRCGHQATSASLGSTVDILPALKAGAIRRFLDKVEDQFGPSMKREAYVNCRNGAQGTAALCLPARVQIHSGAKRYTFLRILRQATHLHG